MTGLTPGLSAASPSQVAEVTQGLSDVDVSARPIQLQPDFPLTFGSLPSFGMSGRQNQQPPAGDASVIAQLKQAQRDQEVTLEDLATASASTKQDMGEIMQQVRDLATLVTGYLGQHGLLLGPEDLAGVQDALSTSEKRTASIRKFGMPWLAKAMKAKQVPQEALFDEGFMRAYVDWGRNPNSMATDMPLPDASAKVVPTVPALTQHNPFATPLFESFPDSPLNKDASGSLHSQGVPVPSSSGAPLPFATAASGHRVKFDLPRPNKFSRISADSDIHAWLLRMREYLTVAGIPEPYWVVFAGNYLDRSPLQLWEARKAKLRENPAVLYSWDSFNEWCISNFGQHNQERHALSQLEQLRQTGSVAEYMAAHNVLASQSDLPMQLRIFWWEKGLKEDIRAMCRVDPLTYKEYTDIDKAQSAACACDAHLNSAAAAAANKNKGRASPIAASSQIDPKRARTSFEANLPKAKDSQWTGDSPESFTVINLDGPLAEPIPGFFAEWIGKCVESPLTGKRHLPKSLCAFSNKQGQRVCYFKKCQKSGHNWMQCPKLALGIAKNPTVRDCF